MRGRYITAIALAAWATPVCAQDSDAEIKKAVRTCVDLVHRLTIADPLSARFFGEFDAYYNPATKRVINNGYRNGDIPPQYEFGKCMAGQGFPLE
jgi:hypothetical protein